RRRQLCGLRVEILELDVDLTQRFLEVEVLVLLLRRDAHITARREAPVCILELLPVDELYQSLDVAELTIGEALGEPLGLAPEVAHLAQVLDGELARVIQILALTGDVPTRPG